MVSSRVAVAASICRWWDGFLDGVPVAAEFTRNGVLAKLEEAVQWRCGEDPVLAGMLIC